MLPSTISLIIAILAAFLLVSNSLKPSAPESTYTNDEKKAIEKFRTSMKEKMTSSPSYMQKDEYLILWLRAKHLDVDDAKFMLEQNLAWRKEQDIDSLVTEEFSEFEKSYLTDLESVDTNGRPVYLVPAGFTVF